MSENYPEIEAVIVPTNQQGYRILHKYNTELHLFEPPYCNFDYGMEHLDQQTGLFFFRRALVAPDELYTALQGIGVQVCVSKAPNKTERMNWERFFMGEKIDYSIPDYPPDELS